MPIAKEIISMFEISKNPKITISMNALCRKKIVYPEIDKHSLHRYALMESHRKASVVP